MIHFFWGNSETSQFSSSFSYQFQLRKHIDHFELRLEFHHLTSLRLFSPHVFTLLKIFDCAVTANPVTRSSQALYNTTNIHVLTRVLDNTPRIQSIKYFLQNSQQIPLCFLLFWFFHALKSSSRPVTTSFQHAIKFRFYSVIQ